MALVRCRGGRGDVLHRDAVRCDVVDLPRRGDVHQVVGLHLDFVPRRQKGVEAHDEIWVTLKELGHSTDHTWSVDTARGFKKQNKKQLNKLIQKSFTMIIDNSDNHSSPLRLKLFHDVQKVVVNLWLTSELQLHLVQVRQGILHLQQNNTRRFRGFFPPRTPFTHLFK